MISGINTDDIVPEFMLATVNYSQPVRIGWSIDDPLVTECFKSKLMDCASPGYEVEYIHTIVNGILKLDVEFVYFENYDDMEVALTNRDIDTTGLSYFVDRHTAIEDEWGWAPVYLWDGTALIAREFDQQSNDTLLLLQAFTYDLWLAIVLSTIGTMTIRWLSKKLYKTRMKSEGNVNVVSKVAYWFRAKILYVLWFLLLGIILSFYGNVFAVNLLTSSKQKVIAFNDMTDLGNKLLSGKCRLAIYDAYRDDNEFHGTIINPNPERSNKSWAHLYREAFKMNKTYYAPTREDMMKKVLTDECTVGLDWWTMESYFTSHWCNVRIVMYPEERQMFYQYTFYTLRDDIRDAVYSVIAHSSLQLFNDYLAKKYYLSNSPPDCGTQGSSLFESLNISKLQGSLYLWLMGMAMATIILIYENVKVKHPEWIGKHRSIMSIGSLKRVSTKWRSNVIGQSAKNEATTQITPSMKRRQRQHFQLWY